MSVSFFDMKLSTEKQSGHIIITVTPVLSGHSKIDKSKILMTNGCLMKVESITECSPSAILLTCINQ